VERFVDEKGHAVIVPDRRATSGASTGPDRRGA
jgi:hypothetical protein